MMSRAALLFASSFLIHCHSAPGSAQDDPEKEALRRKLAEAHVRILKLETDKARLSGKPEEELRILIESGLASEYGEVRAAALLELGALPEERRKAAVPEVLKRYPSAPGPFKVQAVAFLGRVPSPEAEAAVLGAASDPSPAVRISAASALKTSAKEEAVRALLALLKDPAREVRIAAVDALGAARRETAVGPLLGFLEGEKDDVLLEKAADALGAVGSPAAVDALRDLLRRTSRETVRWSCINSLGKIGDRRAVEDLLPYLEAVHATAIREIAVESLGKIKDPAALEGLLRILRSDREEKLRLKAASAVGRTASPPAIEELLLPAYAGESSAEVRRALWESVKALAGEEFEPNERLILALLKRGLRAEAEEACTRLHAAKPDEKLLPRRLAMEEGVAQAAQKAGDPKAALPHFRQALLLAPDSAAVRREVVSCYRGLKDLDSAVKILREIDPRLPQGEAAWWANKFDIIDLLKQRGDAEALVMEVHGLLLLNPPPHPEERKKLLDKTFREAALHLLQPLAEPDEAARKTALEAVRRQAKLLAAWLAAELEAAPAAGPAPLVEAAAAILGAAQDASKPKETAAALRAWLAQPSKPNK